MRKALPESIAAYFSAKGGIDTESVVACFTRTAIIVDEGENKVMNGHKAIREWLDGPISGYELTTEVTDSSESEGKFVVTALVSGNFPGSPIKFYYHFRLVEGKIDRLDIK